MKMLFHIWAVHIIDYNPLLHLHNKPSSSPLAFTADVESIESAFGMRLYAAMKIYWYCSKCYSWPTSGCMNQKVIWRPLCRSSSGLDVSSNNIFHDCNK
jgi:hypothetical protein